MPHETPIPLLIAHRGASWRAPENTLAAFRLAWQEHADGIEADFRLTGDGRIACMHDRTTLRTTGARLGIAKSTWEQLRALDAGMWKGLQWRGETIPALPDVLAALPEGKRLFMELKGGREIIKPLTAVLQKWRAAAGRIRILSFNKDLLHEIKHRLPEFRTCLLADLRWREEKPWRPSKDEILQLLEQASADGLAGRAGRAMCMNLIRLLRQGGKEIHVWTVNRPRAASHFTRLGVDSIITNRPAFLREVLSGKSGTM